MIRADVCQRGARGHGDARALHQRERRTDCPRPAGAVARARRHRPRISSGRRANRRDTLVVTSPKVRGSRGRSATRSPTPPRPICSTAPGCPRRRFARTTGGTSRAVERLDSSRWFEPKAVFARSGLGQAAPPRSISAHFVDFQQRGAGGAGADLHRVGRRAKAWRGRRRPAAGFEREGPRTGGGPPRPAGRCRPVVVRAKLTARGIEKRDGRIGHDSRRAEAREARTTPRSSTRMRSIARDHETLISAELRPPAAPRSRR